LVNNLKIPTHIAFILDGNRRWAKKHSLPVVAGHKKGAETLMNITKGASELGLKYMTVYAFSTENWKRSEEEVSDLMGLLRQYLDEGLAKIAENNIKIVFIGEKDMLADDIRSKMQKLERESAKNSGLTLCVALSYGSRQEIVAAVKKIAALIKNGDISIKDIDTDLFSDMLYTSGVPDPDLLIRTSGEQRISNYLLWQSAYTEFYFSDILWPDFSMEELKKIIKNFSLRERRYGKN